MRRPIHELAAAWETAEARLYPIAMTRPEAYARALELVREIATELEPFGTVEQLAAGFDRAAELAARAVERSGASTDGLDVGLAAAAAFALRYRSILVSTSRNQALERIQTARARGDAWVEIAVSGDPGTGLYLSTEMHLPDGRAVRSSVTFDAETGQRRFELETVLLDPSTGERLDLGSAAEVQTFDDADAWTEAVARTRRGIEERAG